MLQNYKSNPVAERKSGKKIHFCYNNMNINKIYSLGLRIWPGGYAERVIRAFFAEQELISVLF